jgi:hypothetical protein
MSMSSTPSFITSDKERLFLNSVSSPYTRSQYKVHLQKYLQICGYKDTAELLSKDHIEIENQLIDFIISCKEKGMKHGAISNYLKPVVTLCKISDITVNTKKVTRRISKIYDKDNPPVACAKCKNPYWNRPRKK